MNNNLPVARLSLLKKLLNYDPTEGSFTFKKRYPLKDNKTFNTRYEDEYALDTLSSHSNSLRGTILGKEYTCAKMVWYFEHGYYPAEHMNYYDGDPYNTCIDNLYI